MARGSILVVTTIVGQSSILGPRIGLDVGEARVIVFGGLNGIGWLEYGAGNVTARPLNDGELAGGLVIAGLVGFELPARYESYGVPQARFVLETSHRIWEGFATAEAAEAGLRWRRGGMMGVADGTQVRTVDEPVGIYRFAAIPKERWRCGC